MTLSNQQPVVACVLDQAPTRLDEALLETGHRPRVDSAPGAPAAARGSRGCRRPELNTPPRGLEHMVSFPSFSASRLNPFKPALCGGPHETRPWPGPGRCRAGLRHLPAIAKRRGCPAGLSGLVAESGCPSSDAF